MSAFSGRRRVAPRERFAGNQKHFSLDREFEQLPRESEFRQGHMQKAIYRHGSVTTGIFTFEANGTIEQHQVEGESSIHVLEGELFVSTPENEYTLHANDILLLDPTVPHDIRAVQPSRMLMTVVLNDGEASGPAAG